MRKNETFRFKLKEKHCMISETNLGYEACILAFETRYKKVFEIVGNFNSKTAAINAVKAKLKCEISNSEIFGYVLNS
jgi:hypothetical protein